jgi:hypothetical protein
MVGSCFPNLATGRSRKDGGANMDGYEAPFAPYQVRVTVTVFQPSPGGKWTVPV